MALTNANIVSRVNELLGDYPQKTRKVFTGDGSETVFKIYPHSVDSNTVTTAYSAGSPTETWNYNNSTVLLSAALGDGATLTCTFDGTFYAYDAKVNAITKGAQKLAIKKEDDSSVTTAASTRTYDLPAECWKLLEVHIYDSDKTKTAVMHKWKVRDGTGTAGVDQLYFQHAPPYTRSIRLVYLKKAVLSDLPDEAEDCLAYFVCWRLLHAHEGRRGRFDKLPAYDEKLAQPFHGMRQADDYLNQFEEAAKRLNLWPTLGSGYLPIEEV